MKKPHPTTKTAITNFDSNLAQLLDSKFIIPGTKWRMGLDGLIGLIPGAGDLIMAMLSLYFIVRAFQERMKWYSILAMIWRVLLEMLIGSIPIVGDIFDIWYKANIRNNNALQKHIKAKNKLN